MRILHVDRQRHWTGQQSRTYQIIQHLAGKGHEVFLACHPNSEYERRARRDGLNVFPIPMRGRSVAMAYLRLARLMRREKIELVDVHGSVDHQMVAGAAPFARRPVVVRTKHKNLKLKSGWLSRLVYCPPITHKIIAISDAVRQQLVSDGIPHQQVELIYEAINLERFRPDLERLRLRDELGFSSSHILIGSASRLHHSKGIDVLLQAFARLHRRCPETRYVHAGHGSIEKFTEIARREGIPAGAAVFLGPVEKIETFYPSLDLFCLPSRSEGLGIVLLEAMACKVPAVASCTGGIPEVVIDGQTGILVPPEDAEALGQALEALVRSPEQRRRFGEAARERVESHFDSRLMLERTERLYLDLLERKSRKNG
ncbi:MAG: glycosyltransferase [Planctomycetes bacterium]|nr:glycosyltransferase [Planctomycetota bacterium]